MCGICLAGTRVEGYVKILHLITGFQVGGAERFAVNLAIGLAKRGLEGRVVGVLHVKPPNEIGALLRAELKAAGIETRDLGARNRRLDLLRAGLSLGRMIGTWNPDAVHSHTDVPDFVVSIARRLRRFRIIRTIHNTELWPSRPIIGRFTERAFRDDLVVCPSRDAARAYKRLRHCYGLPESAHQALIYNAVPPHRSVGVRREDIIARLGADPSRTLLCFIGRLTSQKGPDILVEAVAMLPAHLRDAIEVHVIGDGEYRETLAAYAGEHRLPIRVHGEVASASDLLPAFDALLMPSRFEGLPLVALEAMDAGTPLIATDAPGLREALPTNWPFVAAAGSAPSLARQIEAFLKRPADRASLSRRMKDWGHGNFSFDAMIDRYDQAYRAFLEAELGSSLG